MTRRIIPVGEELPPMDSTPSPSSNARHGCQTGDRDTPKRKTGERFVILNAFVDFALANLRRREVAVWLVLYRDTKDGTAQTSYDAIAERAGLNRRNVGRAIQTLGQLGLLRIVHRGGLGRGPSHYRVLGLPKDG